MNRARALGGLAAAILALAAAGCGGNGEIPTELPEDLPTEPPELPTEPPDDG